MKRRITIRKLLKTPYYVYRILRDILYCYATLGTWSYTWRFNGLPIIRKEKKARIEIGRNFVATSNPLNNSIGTFQRVLLYALKENAIIRIGNNVGMSGSTISCYNSISIGNNVLVGSGVLITDNDAHPINYWERDNDLKIKARPIVVQDDVFIGTRSIILKGVTIGKGAVIGAGSVVVKDVPEMTIVAGNPASIIGKIKKE